MGGPHHALAALRAEHPGVVVQPRQAAVADIRQALREGTVALAVVALDRRQQRRPATRLLSREDMVLLASPGRLPAGTTRTAKSGEAPKQAESAGVDASARRSGQILSGPRRLSPKTGSRRRRQAQPPARMPRHDHRPEPRFPPLDALSVRGVRCGSGNQRSGQDDRVGRRRVPPASADQPLQVRRALGGHPEHQPPPPATGRQRQSGRTCRQATRS
ncbi:LysR substrate-binding domain-containing protein [Streptomyces sp. NBC_01236]|uniref:LysR substrate-binding domain-containing protein n=1 Tax=Streptomyces sp. NBC_01236 TaxID=2903789 RepID=UPI002E14B349|nr:LysR substrate-binding domain-containing protein [Streptomyces sp. NBC_01236]